jgi:hypothetical protein
LALVKHDRHDLGLAKLGHASPALFAALDMRRNALKAKSVKRRGTPSLPPLEAQEDDNSGLMVVVVQEDLPQ